MEAKMKQSTWMGRVVITSPIIIGFAVQATLMLYLLVTGGKIDNASLPAIMRIAGGIALLTCTLGALFSVPYIFISYFISRIIGSTQSSKVILTHILCMIIPVTVLSGFLNLSAYREILGGTESSTSGFGFPIIILVNLLVVYLGRLAALLISWNFWGIQRPWVKK
jgi:hypothetical protein